MSKYTIKGSAELDEKIDGDLRRIAEVASPHSLAGVLLGGYGRGEGTPFINPDGSQSPFNDYDLMVVVRQRDRKTFQALENQLTRELGLPVDLYPVLKTALPTCEFSLLNYEMKYGHKVVWGDENILSAMPDYPHAAIPRSEGTRLLLNRGKLLLDIKQRLENPEPLHAEERLRSIKFIQKAYLAMGDCALLAEGRYDLSYTVKKERIPTIGAVPDREAVVDGYLKAVALKEWGDFHTLENFDVPAEFKTVRVIFLRFFSSYRAHGSNRECGVLKAMALNLRWNGRPLPRHPRIYLYEALAELLKDDPCAFQLRQALFSYGNHVERFHLLQRRFS